MSARRKSTLLAIAASIALVIPVQQSSAQSPAPAPDAPAATTPAAPAPRPQVDRKFGSAPDDPGPLATDVSPAMTQKAVAFAMRKVADWQLAQSQEYFTVFDRSRQLDGRIWTWGALYSGFMAASDSLGDPKYRNVMRDMGKTYNWELSTTESDANQHSLAQTYLELYLLDKQPEELAPTKATFDGILAKPRIELNTPGKRLEWWWCDALFMAPPAWARLYAATGDRKYVTYLDEEWAKTSTQLYDPATHLYFRDATFTPKTEKNGQKIFWSRGEGWVMAGLARTLEYLPKDDPARATYVTQLKEMSAAVAKLQGPDGLWRSGMLDPASYDQPEISGSALMTFGMAWGVNNGILDPKVYTPVIQKAWAGMIAHIYADGRLGDIQQTGSGPALFKPSSSFNYGVGGFLLAGSEIYKMKSTKHGK